MKHSYTKVQEGFQSFFVVKKNIVYEHARFNMRKQEENENVDAFVTALYALASRTLQLWNVARRATQG